MLENISLSLQSIWSHKLRSLLTMLGIIIGIASIITIVSTIKGTNEQIKENIIGSGSNVVNVRLTREGYDYEFEYEGNPVGINVINDDLKNELKNLPEAEDISLYRTRQYSENIFYKNLPYSGSVYGVDDSYLKINDYKTIAGRDFLETDFKDNRKCVIVEADTASKLFEGENPIGSTLEIREEPFTVVGLVQREVSQRPEINNIFDYEMYKAGSTGAIFIPDSCWQIIYRYDEPQSVAIKAKSADEMTKAGKGAEDVLNSGIDTDSKIKYEAEDLLKQAANMQTLANSARSQLLWIAGISLLVGGIGVMNIMMVSVAERTREIGLKKAIGARRSRILGQFLTEASVLCAIGGLMGVGCGIGLSKLLSAIIETPSAISIPACVIAVLFSTGIGLLFGLIPAVKASRLNPIEALNRE